MGFVMAALPEGVASAINTALTTYGTTLLDYFVELLVPIAALSAILFVISIIKNKVGA